MSRRDRSDEQWEALAEDRRDHPDPDPSPDWAADDEERRVWHALGG